MDMPNDLAAIEQLLAERDALHAWLARLDQSGPDTPESVRARVRLDYALRLDGLTGRLREHSDTIAARLRDDRTEHGDLTDRSTTAREALAESELRFAVGEYDRDRFEAERTRHASDIEAFELSLAATGERIARLEDALAQAQREPHADESADLPEVLALTQSLGEPAWSDAASVIHEPSLLSDDGAALDEPQAIGIGELAPDDTDKLLSIFDDDVAPSGASGAPGPLSFRPSSSMPDTPPAVRPTTSAPPMRAPEPSRAEPANGGALLASDIVASGPAPDVAPAAPVGRTMRCGECGAMNKPLEWYCEKCGAELTAV